MTVTIHPTALIAEGAVFADNVTIGAYSLIGSHVVLKENVTIHSHVVLEGRTTIGAGTEIFPFATIGLPPQNIHCKGENASVTIGEKCIIREHVTIHAGTEKGGMKTTVGNGCYIMVGAHIAHDCHIGNSVIMANNATLGGHVIVGDYVNIGGLAAVRQFVRIGAHAMISGLAGVSEDIMPFANILAAKATLRGLNLVGMRRRGLQRQDIQDLRNAYNVLAKDQPGTLAERIQKMKNLYGHSPVVQDLITFIGDDSKRPLALPLEGWECDASDEGDEPRAAGCA